MIEIIKGDVELLYMAIFDATTSVSCDPIKDSLDWFTSELFDDSLLLAQSLRNVGLDLEIEQISPGTLHGGVPGLRVTFLRCQYPLLKSFHYWKEMDCKLAALKDIASMKLSAIAQRGARKD